MNFTKIGAAIKFWLLTSIKPPGARGDSHVRHKPKKFNITKFMKKSIEKTKVIFRIFPKKEGGEVIAIFPRNCGTNDPATCSSYMHVGQHSSCNPHALNSLRLATRAEYADLKRELENYGPGDSHYKLDIRKRCTRADYEERKRQIRDMA